MDAVHCVDLVFCLHSVFVCVLLARLGAYRVCCVMLQGIFVGALLSMSSTSVVVKCLESFRMNSTAFGQIVIGTLILQVW